MLFKMINFLLAFLNQNILVVYIINKIRSKICFLRNSAFSNLDGITENEREKRESLSRHQALVKCEEEMNKVTEPENESSEVKLSSVDLEKNSDRISSSISKISSNCASVKLSNCATESLSNYALEMLYGCSSVPQRLSDIARSGRYKEPFPESELFENNPDRPTRDFLVIRERAAHRLKCIIKENSTEIEIKDSDKEQKVRSIKVGESQTNLLSKTVDETLKSNKKVKKFKAKLGRLEISSDLENIFKKTCPESNSTVAPILPEEMVLISEDTLQNVCGNTENITDESSGNSDSEIVLPLAEISISDVENYQESLQKCFEGKMVEVNNTMEINEDKYTGTSELSEQVSDKEIQFLFDGLTSIASLPNINEEISGERAKCKQIKNFTRNMASSLVLRRTDEPQHSLTDKIDECIKVKETYPYDSNSMILPREDKTSSNTENQVSSRTENTDEKHEIDPSISELFQWMEEKIGILKSLPTSSEFSTKDRTVILESILEDIDLNRKRTFKPQELNSIIKTLEEAALRILEDTKSSSNCQRIKDLLSLTKNLSATFGAEVTIEDVKKYINGKRVMDLFDGYQRLRYPVILQMKAITKYIEYGLEEIDTINEEFKEHCLLNNAIYSKDFVPQNLKELNEKLDGIASESQDFLMHFENALNYLLTKTKNFFSLKVNLERLITTFMTTEIKGLFKEV